MQTKLTFLITTLIMISGCGGGGGGTTPPVLVPPPVSPPDPSAPLMITTGNSQDVVSIVLAAANTKIQLAHAAGHLAAQIVEQGIPSGFAICSDTGEYSGQITDDGDGQYSVGDVMSIDFGSCTSGNVVTNISSSGEVTITAIDVTPSGEFQIAGDYQIPGAPDSGMEIAYAVTFRGESVVARIDDANNRLVIGDNAFTDFMFRFDTKGLNVNGSYTLQFESSVESGQLDGTFSCTTDELYGAIRTRELVAGILSCSGDGTAIARQSTFPLNTDVIEFSASGVGPFEVVRAFGLANIVDDFLLAYLQDSPWCFLSSCLNCQRSKLPSRRVRWQAIR